MAEIQVTGTKISALTEGTLKDADNIPVQDGNTNKRVTGANLKEYVSSSLKPEITATIPTKLSQLENDDHTVKDADYVHTDNNYSDEEKTKVSDSLRLKEYADVSSLKSLPSSPYNLRFTYSGTSVQAISFADAASVPEMQEFTCPSRTTPARPSPSPSRTVRDGNLRKQALKSKPGKRQV